MTKLSWRGPYERTVVIGRGRLSTYDPQDSRQTNAWPILNLLSVDQQGPVAWVKLRVAKHWWQHMRLHV